MEILRRGGVDVAARIPVFHLPEAPVLPPFVVPIAERTEAEEERLLVTLAHPDISTQKIVYKPDSPGLWTIVGSYGDAYMVKVEAGHRNDPYIVGKTMSEADQLHDESNAYYEIIERAGVLVPERDITIIQLGEHAYGHDVMLLVERQSKANGKSHFEMLTGDCTALKGEKLFRNAVSVACRMLPGMGTEHGFDINPGNMVGEDSVYVDFTPPRIVGGRDYYSELLQRRDQNFNGGRAFESHYTARGIIEYLFVFYSGLRPEMLERFQNIAEELLENNPIVNADAFRAYRISPTFRSDWQYRSNSYRKRGYPQISEKMDAVYASL